MRKGNSRESGNQGDAVLDVQGLRTSLFVEAGEIKAVNDISLSIGAGQVLGLVGESGCGKSMAALSVMRLLPTPPAAIVGGAVRLAGIDLLSLPDEDMRRIRGGKMSMIFQEPMTSLNPVFTIGSQIVECIALHTDLSSRDAKARAIDMLGRVGIPAPEKRFGDHPHHLSGGMRQRVMIAMALSCDPTLLIADEPTTALDVTIQAQILDLLHELQSQSDMSMLLITHDLGVIAEVADQVAVMYLGQVVELCTADQLFEAPMHPYAVGLLRATPTFERPGQRLSEIPGALPSALSMPSGCAFRSRCDRATQVCADQPPQLEQHDVGHWVRCWNAAT